MSKKGRSAGAQKRALEKAKDMAKAEKRRRLEKERADAQRKKTAELLRSGKLKLKKAKPQIVVSIPDLVLYGSTDGSAPLRFPHINKLLAENGTVAFEADTLIKLAQRGEFPLYQKGIGVLRRERDLFEVCELTVRHRGLEMTGVGFTRGWCYRRQQDGTWLREETEGECDCGSEIVHGRHLSALHIAEDFLKNPEKYK